jgi:hypothetical protein
MLLFFAPAADSHLGGVLSLFTFSLFLLLVKNLQGIVPLQRRLRKSKTSHRPLFSRSDDIVSL